MRGYNTPTSGGSSRGHDLDAVGRIFQALSNQTRRHILCCLSDARDSLTISELVAQIRSDDHAADQLRTAFWHVHLPRLERCRLVRVNRTKEVVELTEEGEFAVTLSDSAQNQLESLSG